MDPFEDRIRTALRDRGGDVEPTPHLYRQVQRRITRRRRRLAWTLAPAGVAVLAAVVVPLVLSGGPQVPTIADLADQPGVASATGAAQLVIVDATGATGVVDLPSGERSSSLAEAGDTGTQRVLVAPERRDDPPIAVVVGTNDATAGTGDAAPRPGEAPSGPPSSPDGPAVAPDALRATAHVDGRRLLLPSDPAPGSANEAGGGAVLTPDGRWLATLASGSDADGWSVQLTSAPRSADTGEFEGVGLALVVPAGSRLESWTELAGESASRLAVRDPDGRILHLPMVAGADGVPVWDDEQVAVAVAGPVDAYTDDHTGGYVTVADGVLSHVRPVEDDRSATGAALEDGEPTTGVSTADGEVRTEADISALTDGADSLDLRAFGTTTVLTTDAGTWWLERGDEGWTTPVPIEHGAVDAVPVGRDLAPVETPGEPEDGPTPSPPAPPAEDDGGPAPDTPVAPTGPLGDGLVVADDTTVALVGPDGTREELYTFPAEGESTIVDVAVRPGSTADDVTVLISTQAEGMFDLRWLRASDGEPATPQVVEAGPFPLAAADLGVPPTPAWSPEGDLLAVVTQPDADGPVELRTLGWDDDGPSTDPNLGATFTLDTDRPWSVTGWVWTDGADGEVARSGQLVLLDPLGPTSALLDLERQGDGAVALAPDAAPVVRGEGDLALAVGGGRGPGGLDAELARGDDGAVTLRLWRWTDAQGGTGTDAVEVDVSGLAGPRDGRVLAGWPQGALVALDPAEPRIVDRTSGEISEPPFAGEVVAADALR